MKKLQSQINHQEIFSRFPMFSPMFLISDVNFKPQGDKAGQQ